MGKILTALTLNKMELMKTTVTLSNEQENDLAVQFKNEFKDIDPMNPNNTVN